MTNETKASERQKAPRRWPTALLAVSLTLNLLVLSLIAGAHFRDEHDASRFPPPDRSVMRATGFGPFFDAMPRAARNRMGEALRARGDGFAPDRDALAAELRDVLAALRAEPFDPAALEAVLVAQHARAQARIEAGRDVLLGQVATMSPVERRGFADQLEQRFSHALNRSPNGKPGETSGPEGN
jgi:uncharacterized membrane protein